MTVDFPDLSHYDRERGLTTLAGAQAVICKATQGTSYVDPTYASWKAQAAALGIPQAAYHWLDTTDAVAQARHAYAVVGPDTMLMIDDEQNIIVVPHTLAFLQAYRALGGTVRLEYAPRWVWDNSGRPDLSPLAAAGLSIVASNYSAGPDNPAGWASYGGITPAILQYTSSQPFNDSDRTDFNRWRGTLDQLRALLTTGDMMDWSDPLAFTVPAAVILEGEPAYGKTMSPSARDVLWYTLVRAHIAQRAAEAARDYAKTAAERPYIDPVAAAAALATNADFVDRLAAAVAAKMPMFPVPMTVEQTAQAAFEGAQRAERE